ALLDKESVFLLVKTCHWTDPYPSLVSRIRLGVTSPLLIIRVTTVVVVEVDIGRSKFACIATWIGNRALHRLLGERSSSLGQLAPRGCLKTEKPFELTARDTWRRRRRFVISASSHKFRLIQVTLGRPPTPQYWLKRC